MQKERDGGFSVFRANVTGNRAQSLADGLQDQDIIKIGDPVNLRLSIFEIKIFRIYVWLGNNPQALRTLCIHSY